jgi:hypothetical protein
MSSRIDHEVLLSLMDRSGLDERGLAIVLGVHQTTVWRLRGGKIAKVDKYIDRLRSHLGETGAPGDAELVAGLVALSRHSPGLRELLRALHRFMQESA